MGMKAWVGVAALTLGALGMASAAQAGAQPYDINVVLPLTGPVAFLGKAEQVALERMQTQLKGADGVGGRSVRFVFHDDQSSPQTAVQLASQLVVSHPSVVLGSSVVALCNAMAPLASHGPVMYCFSPGIHPRAGSYVFSSSIATRDLLSAQLRYFLDKGWTRVAVINSTDASGQDVRHNLAALLPMPEFKRIDIVAKASFNPTDVSASAQIEGIKASKPQAIIAWSTGSAIGTVFKGLADAGVNLPVATTDGNMTYAQMKQYASFLPKQLLIPSPEWLPDAPSAAPQDQVVAKARLFGSYRQAGLKPDAAATFAWDPALLVVHALHKLGPNATAEQLRAYLASQKEIYGVNGRYDFKAYPQRGLSDQNVYITEWDAAAGTWKPVSAPGGKPLS